LPETSHDAPAAGESLVIEWHGRPVHWRRFGAGSPLVLLHGGHGSWRHWQRNIAALAEHHSVWVPDMPGYGDSALPADAGSADGSGLQNLLGALHGTLDLAIGAATPVGLAGFSFGGLIAAHLAVRRPGVRTLALLGPAGHGGRRRPRGELVSWRAAWEAGDTAALAEVMRNNLSAHMLHAPPQDIDHAALALHIEACLKARFRSRPISRAGGLGEALGRYAGPTLLVWGQHDVTAEPAVIGPLMADAAGGEAQWRIVEDAGHWVQYEASQEINRTLLHWAAT
jgi:pimeloyl-ACP methyl ester carboxylesterase